MSNHDHEGPAVGSKAAMVAGVAFVLGMILVLAITAAGIKILDALQAPPPNMKAAQLEPTEAERVQLQAYPKKDRLKMEHESKVRLESYGWNNPQNTIAHIPIDRAISLMAQKGFPVRTESKNSAQSKQEQAT